MGSGAEQQMGRGAGPLTPHTLMRYCPERCDGCAAENLAATKRGMRDGVWEPRRSWDELGRDGAVSGVG